MHFKELACNYDPTCSTLQVSGSVDESRIDTLREAIEECSEHYTHDVRVDLTGVDFLPSVGIGVLSSAMKRADEHGHSIELTASQGSIVDRVLTITGLPHVTS